MVDVPVSCRWKHLTDLPSGWDKLAAPQLRVVADLWRSRIGDLRGSVVLREFNARLARKWSIETGVIEGVYRIDRGITELLIEKGIETALIPHGATDRPAADIVRILRDHYDALEGLFSFVSGKRELSLSYIREMHQQLCASQEFVVGLDTFGARVQRRLVKGDWKRQPNNPHRQDGSLHQYCPPEHVASELESLVRLHKEHVKNAVPPEVEAAWLHHRFTQIHPFEDGNGRVARSLATLVLLRSELFPFIVEREDQGRYIDALEAADTRDNLEPLIKLIARQQQEALLAALDLSRDVIREREAADSLERTLQDATTKLIQKQYKKQQEDFREIEIRTSGLISLAKAKLQSVADQLLSGLGDLARNYKIHAQEALPDQGHWFRFQIVQVAKQLRYFANTYDWHRWTRLLIGGEHGGQIVISFHQSGKDFRGVFMATAFFELRSPDDADEGKVFRPVVEEGFAITLSEEFEQTKSRFNEWLDEAISRGVNEWMKTI